MLDLTVEIQEFQFDKHYDITAHLCYEGCLPTMHNWYQSRVSPEALAHHREQSVGGHQTWHGACPVPRQWELDRWGDLKCLVARWANYLVDKTSSELRPGRPQTVRPTITEKHSSPSAHVFPVSLLSYFLKTIFTKLLASNLTPK